MMFLESDEKNYFKASTFGVHHDALHAGYFCKWSLSRFNRVHIVDILLPFVLYNFVYIYGCWFLQTQTCYRNID
jgi:hypothetical protein